MEKGETQEEKGKMSEEEFLKRLDVANRIINDYMKINIDLRKILAEKLLSDYEDSFQIEQRLGAIEQELQQLRLDYTERVIEAVFGKCYINTHNMTYQEIEKLYSETGFEDFYDDDAAVHLGFVKVAGGYALLYTFSEPYDTEWKIEYIIKKQG
jgi:hypothetical protein